MAHFACACARAVFANTSAVKIEEKNEIEKEKRLAEKRLHTQSMTANHTVTVTLIGMLRARTKCEEMAFFIYIVEEREGRERGRWRERERERERWNEREMEREMEREREGEREREREMEIEKDL